MLVLARKAVAPVVPETTTVDVDAWGVDERPQTLAIADLLDEAFASVSARLGHEAFARALDARKIAPVTLDRIVGGAMSEVVRSLNSHLHSAFADAHIETQDFLRAARGKTLKPKDFVVKAVSVSNGFKVENARAGAWAATATASLVTRVAQQTKDSIKAIVARGWGHQGPVKPWGPDGTNITVGEMKRDVRTLLAQSGVVGLGLTQQGENALAAMRTRLLDEGKPDAVILARTKRYADTLRLRRGGVIARTEVSDSLNAGQQQAWTSAADDGLLAPDTVRVWIASPGSKRTCPTCGGLDGAKAKLDEPFKHSDGREFFRPPAHPNCFPAGVIVDGPRAVASTERHYSGPLVEIETVSGRRVSVTPNHPILTSLGWVAAGALKQGDDLVCHALGERPPATVDEDDADGPAPIEQVARALGEVPIAGVPTAAEDFHGDGLGSEVHVVRADRLLRGHLDPSRTQPPGKRHLCDRCAERARLSGGGTLAPPPQAVLAPEHSHVRGGGSGLPDAGVDTAGLFDVRLDAPPQGDSRRPESSAHGPTSDVESGSERVLALTGEVTLDDLGIGEVDAGALHLAAVLRVSRHEFRGTVFNLQTVRGWYTANGILTHNCRCTVGLSTTVPDEPGLFDVGYTGPGDDGTVGGAASHPFARANRYKRKA